MFCSAKSGPRKFFSHSKATHRLVSPFSSTTFLHGSAGPGFTSKIYSLGRSIAARAMGGRCLSILQELRVIGAVVGWNGQSLIGMRHPSTFTRNLVPRHLKNGRFFA